MNDLRKIVALMLFVALVLPNGLALGRTLEAPAGQTQETEEEVQLVTARVRAELVQPGPVLMSARGNHWVYDSVPPFNGPNEEINPAADGMLAALIACGMYIYEAVSIEQEIEINSFGEFDPRGAARVPVNPRMRAFHVTMNVNGPTSEEAAAIMTEAFRTRCPIYTTLALSAPITVINVVDGKEQEPFATEADPIVNNVMKPKASS